MAYTKISNKGDWDAGSNAPSLSSFTTERTPGDYYTVTNAGTVDLGWGELEFSVGDNVVWNGSYWEPYWNVRKDGVATLADIAGQELSVAGDGGTIGIQLGSETLSIIGGSGITTSASGNAVTITASGTNILKISHNGGAAADLDLGAGDILNISGSGATSVSRTGTSYTISSTDTNTDTNNYVTGASWSDPTTSTKRLSLTRSGLGTLTADFTLTLDAVCDKGNSTNQAILSDSYFQSGTGNFRRDGSNYINFDGSNCSIYIGGTEEARIASNVAYFDGNIIAYSTAISSDRKLKSEIRSINDPGAIIDSITGYKGKMKGEDTYFFIAQEVEDIMPELVSEHEGIKRLNYDAMVVPLWEEVKRLRERVKVLEDEL